MQPTRHTVLEAGGADGLEGWGGWGFGGWDMDLVRRGSGVRVGIGFEMFDLFGFF